MVGYCSGLMWCKDWLVRQVRASCGDGKDMRVYKSVYLTAGTFNGQQRSQHYQ